MKQQSELDQEVKIRSVILGRSISNTRFCVYLTGTMKSQLEYRLPIRWNLLRDSKADKLAYFGSYFAASIFRHTLPFPYAGLNSTNHGVTIGARFSPKPWLSQIVQWEGSWREVSPLEKSGFAARSFSGHSLKSSLTHEITINTLDDQALASKGLYMLLSQELAGLGPGNVGFFKTIAKAEYFKPIRDFSFGVTCAAGIASKIDINDELPSNLNGNSLIHPVDRYWLGGPLELRGFNWKKLGAKEDGNYLGGTAFWRSAVHVLTKLPYIRGDHWISKNVRSHGFLEIGGLWNLTSGGAINRLIGDFSSIPYRLTAGLGLVVRLGSHGRAELNYCFPIKYGTQDSLMNGLQFGIGVNFS